MATTHERYTSPGALLELIREFDALGIHRTGTPGDDATTGWMIRRLSDAGVEAQAHIFTFPKLEVRRALVEVGGVGIQGHAQMDAGLTRPGGVTGVLGSADAPRAGTLALLDVDVGATAGHGIEAAIERCVQAGAAGLIVVARRGAGSVFLLNAPRLSWPWPLPVLLVAPADAGLLIEALTGHDAARLIIEGERRLAEAANVVARIAADAPRAGAGTLGVMTPKSGWFTCAAERGGGIAVWLAAAEAVARTPGRSRDVLFLATAGHELGHAGLEAYLLEHPRLVRETDFWVHLGASIGAAVQPTVGLFAGDAEMQELGRAALDGAGAGPYRLASPGLVPGGEAHNIALRGGRYLSLAGSHAFFHTPEDRPDKVDADSVARYAAAISGLVCRSLGP